MTKLSETAPCTIIAENKHAMSIRQSSLALMILSEDNSEQHSILCGFNRETAALTSMKLIIESDVMGESINTVFKYLIYHAFPLYFMERLYLVRGI